MTLTQVAAIVRRTIIISIVAIVVGLTSFIGYKIWHAYYLAHLPPVEEKPDTKFGLLPQVDFPKSAVSTSNFTYSLDTATGGLPKVGTDPGFEKIIKVYFVTQTFASFLSADRAQALAGQFGINAVPEILSETRYRFRDQNKSLTIDLNSSNFSYSSEATISAQPNLDDDNKLISGFQQTLTTLGVMKEDLKTGRTKITYLKSAGGALASTELRSEAVAAQISLWPANVDKKTIYTSDFNKALISATVLGSADKIENYLILDFIYYPIDFSTFATYPIKTAEAAFDDLKNGKGVIVIEPTNPKVSITAISLGYYLSENYSPYLQPVFVFEGPNFASYVSAVNEQFQSPAK